MISSWKRKLEFFSESVFVKKEIWEIGLNIMELYRKPILKMEATENE